MTPPRFENRLVREWGKFYLFWSHTLHEAREYIAILVFIFFFQKDCWERWTFKFYKIFRNILWISNVDAINKDVTITFHHSSFTTWKVFSNLLTMCLYHNLYDRLKICTSKRINLLCVLWINNKQPKEKDAFWLFNYLFMMGFLWNYKLKKTSQRKLCLKQKSRKTFMDFSLPFALQYLTLEPTNTSTNIH